jgi:hypothetical protein
VWVTGASFKPVQQRKRELAGPEISVRQNMKYKATARGENN